METTTAKPKRRGGRPRHKKTEELSARARSFAMVGMPHHMMAKLMSISTETLIKYYREEMDHGKAAASYAVAKTLYAMAVGDKEAGIAPNLSAAIYWTKSQMQWRESTIVQNQMLGADGNPVDPPNLGISFIDGGPGAVDVSSNIEATQDSSIDKQRLN